MPRYQTAKQRREKQKAKARQRARARGRERKEDAVPPKIVRLHDSGGNTAIPFPNTGLGNCALLGLIALRDLWDGVSRDAVIESTNGELDLEMKHRVQQLREDIVAAADGHVLCDGLLGVGCEESRSFDAVVYDTKSNYDIKTMAMFKAVTLWHDGYLGWRAVMIGAELLRLEGFRIVKSDKEGKLVSTHGPHESTEGIPMLLFHHWGHYEAVFVPAVSLVEVL